MRLSVVTLSEPIFDLKITKILAITQNLHKMRFFAQKLQALREESPLDTRNALSMVSKQSEYKMTQTTMLALKQKKLQKIKKTRKRCKICKLLVLLSMQQI